MIVNNPSLIVLKYDTPELPNPLKYA